MTKRTSKILFVLSIIGILFGLSACLAFSLLGNSLAAFWAFFSALFAALCCMLHVLHIKDILNEWHSVETLSGLKLLGFISSTISFGFTFWYAFCHIYYMLPMLPIKDSMIIALVWSLMTAKWGAFLYQAAHRYSKLLSEVTGPSLLRDA